MNDNIIPFRPPQSEGKVDGWLNGKVRCMACGHTWVAVAQSGTYLFDCPNCQAHKGVYMLPVARHSVVDDHMTCRCNNQFFHVTHRGVYCPNCGDWQDPL